MSEPGMLGNVTQETDQKFIVTPSMAYGHQPTPFVTSPFYKLIDQFLDSLPAVCPTDLAEVPIHSLI